MGTIKHVTFLQYCSNSLLISYTATPLLRAHPWKVKSINQKRTKHKIYQRHLDEQKFKVKAKRNQLSSNVMHSYVSFSDNSCKCEIYRRTDKSLKMLLIPMRDDMRPRLMVDNVQKCFNKYWHIDVVAKPCSVDNI